MKNLALIVSFLFFSNSVFSQQAKPLKRDKIFQDSAENIEANIDLQHYQPQEYLPTDQSKKLIFLLNSEKIISGKELTNIDPKTVESVKVINNKDSTSKIDGIVLIRTIK